jgi:hypothetical protein
MRILGAALVCAAILYGIDTFMFDGRYFTASARLTSEIYRHFSR